MNYSSLNPRTQNQQFLNSIFNAFLNNSGNIGNIFSNTRPRATELFMHDLHTHFPNISDRVIDLTIAPASIIVDGYEFIPAYQENVTKKSGVKVHTYYKLNVDENVPEEIFAHYVVFSEHALERMEERGVSLQNVLKALLHATPRPSYDDRFLVNYENIVIAFKTTSEGFHQVITAYEVGEIFSNCFLEPIHGVDLNATSEDLYNFCKDVVNHETNEHRVGKAALNIVKLISQGYPGKSLRLQEEALDAYNEIWDMFDIACKNRHPQVFTVMDSLQKLLTASGTSLEIRGSYALKFSRYKTDYKVDESSFDTKLKIKAMLSTAPLNVSALLELLMLRLVDHACDKVQCVIDNNIFRILTFDKRLDSLLTLHIINNYACINKIKALRAAVKPYINLENDQAFILLEDNGQSTKRFSTFITWLHQLLAEYVKGFGSEASAVQTTFYVHSIIVGLQLEINGAKMQLYRKKITERSPKSLEKFFAKFLEMAPGYMATDIQALSDLTLEKTFEEYLHFILQTMPLLGPNGYSFTTQMQEEFDFYKDSAFKLCSIYVPILQAFNQVESILNDYDYQGIESPEERYAILNGHARDLFINYFMAIAHEYATEVALSDLGLNCANNREGIDHLLEYLSLNQTQENAEAINALEWFKEHVLEAIHEWDFLHIGRKGKTGYSLMQQLQVLYKMKGAPALFKLYARLLIAQYFFYVKSEKEKALRFLKYVQTDLKERVMKALAKEGKPSGRLLTLTNGMHHLNGKVTA